MEVVRQMKKMVTSESEWVTETEGGNTWQE